MENLTTHGVLRFEPGLLRLLPGTILQDRYRLIRELGTGGMGAVFEAVDQRLDATVAIKETFSTDDRLRRQFEQEARILAQLHHPCLPRVSDYFCQAGRAFLVMQFISGPDLAQILAQEPQPFPRNQVIAWADQLLDALVYLHERDRQIIHRDIKPHNLKVTADGRIALLDFGLAKADHSTTNSAHSIFGYTRRYSPPEQIRDLGTTPQSDIYALGATLYHLLTGIKPPDSMERAAAVANGEIDPLMRADELNSDIEPELAGILNRAMAVNQKDRFKSASLFREELKCLGRRNLEPADRVAALSEAQARLAHAKKGTSRVDPFDSYSILKPEETAFRIPGGKGMPALIAAAAAVVLVLVVIAFPGRLKDTAGEIFEAGPSPSSQGLSEAAIRRAPGATVTRTSIPESASSSTGEIHRKSGAGETARKADTAEIKTKSNPAEADRAPTNPAVSRKSEPAELTRKPDNSVVSRKSDSAELNRKAEPSRKKPVSVESPPRPDPKPPRFSIAP